MPNNATFVDVSGFTKFSRDGTNLESTTTYSRRSVAFQWHFCVSRTQFDDLLLHVVGRINLQDTTYRYCIPAAEHLFICLRACTD
ncbi:hypothetical protein CHARACLAT_021323 [Characodon lateralis]|uniref:Uncharacterized protein n=1 Tax=Characodon lateralis TaxID=208331 RepID=A0ABU7D2J9_9TELE|nr:hypothetical protein [Characodon lateralis]